jgi:hypothetical protein
VGRGRTGDQEQKSEKDQARKDLVETIATLHDCSIPDYNYATSVDAAWVDDNYALR